MIFMEELNSICTYLDPLGLWGVLGNLHQKMKNVLISGALSRGARVINRPLALRGHVTNAPLSNGLESC